MLLHFFITYIPEKHNVLLLQSDIYAIVICLLEQLVAIKQLDRKGLQGYQEFIVEVLMLSLLDDSNLVTLIGYCTDGDQRLLVYEYMSMGSLENHLFGMSINLYPKE